MASSSEAKTTSPTLAQAKACEKSWDRFKAESSKLSADQMIARWSEREAECQGTGIFEFNLAKLYEMAGKRDIAKKIIRDGIVRAAHQ